MNRSKMKILLLLLFSFGIGSAFAAEAEDLWAVRVLRMEGAAVGVRRSAEDVATLATQIAASGRVQRLAELRSKMALLRRKVASARLAAEVLHE